MGILPKISIQVNEHIYLKNPESSDLGRKIVSASIELMDEVGYEAFTFAKLAKSINSTEASVYRYFESKRKLLLYMTDWYWAWMEYRLLFGLANINSSDERLKKAIVLLTEQIQEDGSFTHINEIKLNRIVISEASKVYLTREVDEENKDGIFHTYKELVQRVSDIITEINPDYKYPHMLISTIIEGAHYQRYFAEHIPRLTDMIKGEDAIVNFSLDMVMNTIKK